MTMDMLQKCLQVLQDSQGKIEQKLDDNIKQTKKNTDKIRGTDETSGLHDDRKKSCRRRTECKTVRHSRHPEASNTRRQNGVRDIHPGRNRTHESISQKLRVTSDEQRPGRTRNLETDIQRLHIEEKHQRILQIAQELEHGILGNEPTSLEGIQKSGEDGPKEQ